MAVKLTYEDVEELIETSNRQIREESSIFYRYLMTEIDWRDKLICIKGAKGTGKTTILRQHIRDEFGEDSHKALYVSLDDLWFAKHKVKDLVEYLYEHDYTHLFIDEVHHLGKDWSLVVKNITDQFRNLSVVYSGSSLLQLEKAEGDLSRRRTDRTPGDPQKFRGRHVDAVGRGAPRIAPAFGSSGFALGGYPPSK